MSSNLVIDELQKDLDELLSLQQQAQRKKVQDILNAEISKIKATIDLERKKLPTPVEKAPVEEEAKKDVNITNPSTNTDNFTTIARYSWDQEGKVIKIYLTVSEASTIPSENIKFNVTENSIDLQIFNHHRENYRFRIPKLNNTIETKSCKFTQKTNNIIITLKKANSDIWDQLNYKDKPLKPDAKPEKNEDPNAALMNMMKKLYEEGDDDMKRTIAQAWTKSRDEKGKI